MAAFAILSFLPQRADAQTAGSQSLLVVGSTDGAATSPLTFSMTVNNLTKSVNYCDCVVGGQWIDTSGAIMQGLVNAFNADTTSPVTATLTRAGVTLTPKVAGTFLTISSTDSGAGALGGLGSINFLGIPIVSTQDKASLTVVGSMNPSCSGCSFTFSVNVNNFVKSVTYCECVLGGQLIDSADKIMQVLVNGFNSDSASPVTASLSNGVLTLTAKVAGTVLTVTSSDDGAVPGGLAGISFLGVPIVPALNTAALEVVGSVGPNVPSGQVEPFSVTVNGFTKSVNYCECTQPGVTGFRDNPGAIKQALADAFNADAASPVTAAVGTGGLQLTAKTQGTILTVTSSDGGAVLGGLSGINFLGINGSLPASGATVPGFINPKFIVVGVTYAPPGSASFVDYTKSILFGTRIEVDHTFKNAVNLTVSVKNSDTIKGFSLVGGVTVTGESSTTWTQGSSDGKTIDIEKTTTKSDSQPGPADSFIGLDHDLDLVWVWLNPVVPLTVAPNNDCSLACPVIWGGVGFDPADQPDLDVVPIPVGILNGDIPLSSAPDIATRILRSWASGQAFPPGQGPALTGPGPGTDFDTIVRFDPFWECTQTPANCPTVDSTRFALSDNTPLVYQQAVVGGQPLTQTITLDNKNTTINSSGTTSEFSHEFSMEADFKSSVFGVGVEAAVKTSDTITTTTDTKTDITNTNTSTALASITGPTCTVPTGQNFCSPEYHGPDQFLAYLDDKFGTFMFFPTQDPRFKLSATPATQTPPVGGTVTYTVSSQALDGFTGDVSLSLTGVPQGQGITASFNPTIITGGTGSSTLTISTSSSTPAATSNLTINGTSNTVVDHVPVTLEVQDFTVQVTPSSQTVTAGANTAYQVTVTAVDGMDLSTLALNVNGLPAGATATFSPPTANGVGGVNSTLTIATSASVLGGNYALTVCGTVNGLNHCAVPVNLTVTAPDFTINATPASQTILPGASTTYTISTAALNGFTANIALTLTGLPSGATGSFTPNPIGPGGSSTLTVTTSTTTPGGTYTLNIIGTSGGIVHSTPVLLVVNATQDFTLSITPQAAGIIVGGSTTYTVSIGVVNGFAGNVTLGTSGLPATISATFSPNPAAAGGSSILTLTTSSSTAPGNYSFSVVGISGTLSHSVPATLTVNAPPDFTVAVTPSTQSVTQGSCVSYTLTTTALNGFTGSETISIGGLPAGATATATPSIITGGGTSTITICTTTTTPAGAYAITVTLASGSLSHSQTFTLVVNVPASFSLSANPSSQTVVAGASTSYTLSTTAVGGFNGNVALSVTGLPAGTTATFSPTSIAGAGSSVMTVSTTSSTVAGTYTLNVAGTSGTLSSNTNVTLVVATPQTAVLSPTGLTFSSQLVGTTSTAQTIVLTNSGGATLSISGISTTGDFTQTNNCGTALAPGLNCSIQVTFSPTATGSRTGTITVTDNAVGSPHTASLSGTGTAPIASLSPSSLTFSGVVVGSSSTPQTVTLSNTGTAALSISGISVTGDFSQTNTCGTSLAANSSCSISVTFTPTTTGTRTGTLSVSDNSAGGLQTVSLSGTGNSPPPPGGGGGGCTTRICLQQ